MTNCLQIKFEKSITEMWQLVDVPFIYRLTSVFSFFQNLALSIYEVKSTKTLYLVNFHINTSLATFISTETVRRSFIDILQFSKNIC